MCNKRRTDFGIPQHNEITKKIIKSKKIKDTELVYYDTSIWVAWAIKSIGEQFLHAKKLIDELTPNKKIAVVSDLVIIETIHVLRKKFMKNIRYTGNSLEDIKKAQSSVEHKIKVSFREPIKTLERAKKIQRIKSTMSLMDHHDNVLKKIKNYPGNTKTISVCPECGKRVTKNLKNNCPYCNKQITSKEKYEYTGLGCVDLEHVYFAQSCNVNAFYSFDKGFLILKEDQDFKDKFKIYCPKS